MQRKNPALTASIAQRLRELRKRKGLSQEQLAERSTVPVESISKAENGRVMPTLFTLADLARGLGLGLADIVDPGRPLPPPDLTDEEAQILEAARRMPPEAQAALLTLLTKGL